LQQNIQNGRTTLKLAVVGGGQRCLAIMNLLASRRLTKLKAEIVGVADLNPQAAGFLKAKEKGVFTTHDYRRLLDLPDLDLIIELTGNEKLLRELAALKPGSVGVIDYTASLLFHDIASFGAELERKEDEISMERSFARALTRATSEGVMVLDKDYRIHRINRAACRWADISPENAAGRFCFQVMHQALAPCNVPDTPCPLQETLATGRAAHGIHEFRDSQGEPNYCDVSTYPLVNQQGQIVQVLEIFRDITHELSARVEMRAQAIKQDLAKLVQEDKLLALGKLVASVAHEINNPIASILNFSKLLLSCLEQAPPSEDDLAKWSRWMELTVNEAQRCRDIVVNLLSFARQQSLEPKRLDMVEIIDQIVQITRHRMDIEKVELEYKLPEDPLEIWGDLTQIQQCFTNLVFNALEAMPQGGKLCIEAGLDQDGMVWAEVRDTGKGITPEVLPHIFEPFFSTKSENQGVGLGLSMVYGIISEHKGHIDVDSEPGKWTKFRITLPQAGRPAAAAEVVQ
jgi:two-component system NtrC family sensor kinase